MIELLPAIVINGLLMGGILSLIALGLNIQYGVGKVFNIAHGEFIMLGAFITLTLFTGPAGINPLVSLAISGPVLFIIGFVLYRTLFTSLKKRAPSPAAFEGNSLLVAFGLIFAIQNAALLIWGGLTRSYTFLNFPLYFAGMPFRANQVVACAVAVVVSVAFYIFVTRSRLGKAIRAAAQDPATAELMGINTNMVLALCFGLGVLLAGVAGSLVSMYSSISEVMGLNFAIVAIIVMVLGGLGSIPGSFIGGFIIGLVGSLVTYYQTALVVPAYYALFLLLLLLRPTGILGKR